jgi:hypothetical protein
MRDTTAQQQRVARVPSDELCGRCDRDVIQRRVTSGLRRRERGANSREGDEHAACATSR